MRRIMMFNRVSADGYFAAADASLNWTVPEPEIDKAAGDAASGFDTILFGRKTYEMFAKFWPNVPVDAPTAPDPHNAGRHSPEMRAMAIALNNMTKLVFSNTLKTATWKNSRIVGAFDPAAVEAMKRTDGKGMIVFGSGAIVSLLTRHGLIDEYQFVVSPVLLGNGRQLLTGLDAPAKVTLTEAKSYGSGNVMLRYSRTQS
jgi:dihydrofolate reductase